MRVVPTQVISDAPDAVLDYLVKRTSDTVAAEVGRADAIALGVVEETGGHAVPVLAQDVTALQPWLSGEAGDVRKIMVFRARIRIESWLAGSDVHEQIDVQVVARRDSLGAEVNPLYLSGG